MTFASDARAAQTAFHNTRFYKFRTLRSAKKFVDAVEEAQGIDVKPPKKLKFGNNHTYKYSVTVRET